MAPELFQGSSYNSKVDVYAFGVMLNEMLGRRVPFAGQAAADIRQQVGKPDLLSGVWLLHACKSCQSWGT
jgi:serine/threonine protein kinase